MVLVASALDMSVSSWVSITSHRSREDCLLCLYSGVINRLRQEKSRKPVPCPSLYHQRIGRGWSNRTKTFNIATLLKPNMSGNTAPTYQWFQYGKQLHNFSQSLTQQKPSGHTLIPRWYLLACSLLAIW